MTAKVEKTPTIGYDDFITILRTINECKSEKEVRSEIPELFELINFNWFIFGFGANHLWVSDKKTGKRFIIVEF